MTAAASRQALARKAAVLDAAAFGGLRGRRARRLQRRMTGDRPLAQPTYADIVDAPEWVGWPEERRTLLVRLTGAILCAGPLRRMIDGAVLGRIAGAIGAPALDAVLALPGAMLRSFNHPEAQSGDLDALARLGAAALLFEVADRPALHARVAQLWPDAGPAPSRAAAGQAVGLATGLMITGQAGGSGV